MPNTTSGRLRAYERVQASRAKKSARGVELDTVKALGLSSYSGKSASYTRDLLMAREEDLARIEEEYGSLMELKEEELRALEWARKQQKTAETIGNIATGVGAAAGILLALPTGGASLSLTALAAGAGAGAGVGRAVGRTIAGIATDVPQGNIAGDIAGAMQYLQSFETSKKMEQLQKDADAKALRDRENLWRMLTTVDPSMLAAMPSDVSVGLQKDLGILLSQAMATGLIGEDLSTWGVKDGR